MTRRKLLFGLMKPEQNIGFHASVVGLGNQNPSSVTFTRDANFPTTFEQVTVGTDIFIKFPTMYRKIDKVVSEQITDFTISTQQDDSSYHPYPCFINPSNGEVLPYVLIGKYMISSASVANSVNADKVTMTISSGRDLCSERGTGWQAYDWQFQKLFVDLALVIGQNVNFESGTERQEYLGVNHLQYGHWVDGIAKSASENWIAAFDPTRYVNSPTESSQGYYTLNSYTPPQVTKYITALGYEGNNSIVEFVNFPKANTGGSSNTYYCDYYYYVAGSRPVCSYVGLAHAAAGLWRCNTDFGWSWTYGVRLCYRPL